MNISKLWYKSFDFQLEFLRTIDIDFQGTVYTFQCNGLVALDMGLKQFSDLSKYPMVKYHTRRAWKLHSPH